MPRPTSQTEWVPPSQHPPPSQHQQSLIRRIVTKTVDGDAGPPDRWGFVQCRLRKKLGKSRTRWLLLGWGCRCRGVGVPLAWRRGHGDGDGDGGRGAILYIYSPFPSRLVQSSPVSVQHLLCSNILFLVLSPLSIQRGVFTGVWALFISFRLVSSRLISHLISYDLLARHDTSQIHVYLSIYPSILVAKRTPSSSSLLLSSRPAC
jgi:hypothetical protein